MSEDRDRRFDVTLAALERSVHVPRQDQTEDVPASEPPGSASAWDEERRQTRLAGGA